MSPVSRKTIEMNQKGTSALHDAVERLKRQHSLVAEEDKKIVDIITFCNDPRYLDLPASNFHLWMSQIVTLKCLYMGSQGNENITLTAEEMTWLYDKKQQNVIDWLKKRDSGERLERIFELVLVLGRRASKTMLSSVISAYEIYKILMVGDGDPYAYYGIPYDKEIAVLNVATTKDQAGRLFADIKARVRNAPVLPQQDSKCRVGEH